MILDIREDSKVERVVFGRKCGDFLTFEDDLGLNCDELGVRINDPEDGDSTVIFMEDIPKLIEALKLAQTYWGEGSDG